MKRIVLFFILLFLFTSLLVISNNNIHLFKEKGVLTFAKFYFSWISSLGSNLFSITSNVIRDNESLNSSNL